MTDLNARLAAAMADVANAQAIDIHGKKYTQVATRVAIFRKHFGMDGRLRIADCTETEEGRISMRAVVEFILAVSPTDGSMQWTAVAEGRAEEVRGSSAITRTSAMEVCETSAYGRALANLGLHGGEFASAEEVSTAIATQNRLKHDPMAREQLIITAEHRQWAEAFREGSPKEYRTLYADLKGEGEEFVRAVWSLLPTDLRAAIKFSLKE